MVFSATIKIIMPDFDQQPPKPELPSEALEREVLRDVADLRAWYDDQTSNKRALIVSFDFISRLLPALHDALGEPRGRDDAAFHATIQQTIIALQRSDSLTDPENRLLSSLQRMNSAYESDWAAANPEAAMLKALHERQTKTSLTDAVVDFDFHLESQLLPTIESALGQPNAVDDPELRTAVEEAINRLGSKLELTKADTMLLEALGKLKASFKSQNQEE